MTGFSLSIPKKRISAWVAETDPKYTRAWLDSLPMADSAESAREIYQSLYTLNRQDLDAGRRFELTELYRAPVAAVSTSLESYFARLALPLTPKRRQLAEFIRQLQMEMAYSYKACLQDSPKLRMLWGRKQFLVQATERAMHYLGEVLWRSYHVYMPYPASVWREIHELYRYAETKEMHAVAVATGASGADAGDTTVTHEYLKILLLGLCNPYQLPQNAVRQVQRFLQVWAVGARLQDKVEVDNPGGFFLVDMMADSPPLPFPRDVALTPDQNLRALNVLELVQTIRSFIPRLQRGESAGTLGLGVDGLDSACLDLLRRMNRAWGAVARRQHTRIRRSGHIFLCGGIGALYFFSNNQRPFSPPVSASGEAPADDRLALPDQIEQDHVGETVSDEVFISLDEPVTGAALRGAAEATAVSGEVYRLDRWQVRDSGPKGLFLARYGDAGTHVRVGDIVGVQQVNDVGRWSAGVVRWMKSPESNSLETGIELLASDVKPVVICPTRGNASGHYSPALLLPALDALHRPATLLVERGVYQPDGDVFIVAGGALARPVRLLQLLEQTNSFEQFVFADVQSA